ncbi:hypothetical protein NC651_022185 [Populus alba x Populus x berolinensis]|nr:hypothetical protein NC651_022185 [Populus alba x Populus x berolinensis]
MISGHCLVITFLVDVFQFVPTTRIAQSADIVKTTSETHYRNSKHPRLCPHGMVCGFSKTNLSAGLDYWKLTTDSIFHYLYQVFVLADDSQLAGHAIEENRPMGHVIILL